MEKDVIESLLNEDERIVWEGKPNKKSYLIQSTTPLVITLLGWLILGFSFLIFCNAAPLGQERFNFDAYGGIDAFNVIGMLIIAIPSIIFLIMIVIKILEVNHLRYIITDQRAIIKRGIIGDDYRVIDYQRLNDMTIRIGFFDKKFNTGTIVLIVEYNINPNTNETIKKIDEFNSFMAIDNPYKMFNQIKEISRNMKTDIKIHEDLRSISKKKK